MNAAELAAREAERTDRRPGLYLCGGINGLPDDEAKHWRAVATAGLSKHYRVLDPMARDYRGKEAENVAAIVDGDLADIAAADVLLVRADRPSWGTAMEVFHAFRTGKHVVLFGVPDPCSPWLMSHSHARFPRLNGALWHLTERAG